jgi:Galactoside-binding lectin
VKEFPFKLHKRFHIVIAMTSSSFKVAVEGKHLLTFPFYLIPLRIKTGFTPHHPIFDRITGLKCFALNGMNVHVSGLRHVLLSEDCDSYEKLSIEKSD